VDTESRLTSSCLPKTIRPLRSLGGRIFDFSRQVAVMAIVNRRSDSLYDKGNKDNDSKAVSPPPWRAFFKAHESCARMADRQ